MGENSTKLLTIQEVANFLGVSIYKVRRRIKAKELRAYKVGGQYRISPHDLEMMLRGGSSVDLPNKIDDLDLV